MKLILCQECKEVEALSLRPKTCGCGASGGVYDKDGWHATVWGKALVYGINNRGFVSGRGEFFRYPENNGRITRLKKATRTRKVTVERRKCVVCELEFEGRSDRLTCSDRCRQKRKRLLRGGSVMLTAEEFWRIRGLR